MPRGATKQSQRSVQTRLTSKCIEVQLLHPQLPPRGTDHRCGLPRHVPYNPNQATLQNLPQKLPNAASPSLHALRAIAHNQVSAYPLPHGPHRLLGAGASCTRALHVLLT